MLWAVDDAISVAMLAFTTRQDLSAQGGSAWDVWRNLGFVTVGLIVGMSLPALAEDPRSATQASPCFTAVPLDEFAATCAATTKLPASPAAERSPHEPKLADSARGLPVHRQSLSWEAPSSPATDIAPAAVAVDVDPAIIDSSPVLQRWLEEVPDVSVDIQHDPAFRTRVRAGYSQFPSTDHSSGFYIGVQDVFIGRTPLTLSAEYSANSTGDRQLIGADAQYYLLPLGWYGNVAPVLGYRAIDNSTFYSEGINVGLRIILVPSRTGAADLSLTQSWVAPGTEAEVGLTTFSAGYAIAEDIRIGTDIQTQNTRDRQESRVSLLLEWML